MKKAVLLLRNRPFYGANIVSLPAVHVVRKYAPADHVTVFCTTGLQRFYADVPWVDACVEQTHALGIFARMPNRIDLFYSMRPSMAGAPLIGALRRAGLSLGLAKSSNPLRFLFDYRYAYSKSEYRAVGFLKPLINALGLPGTPGFYMREAMLDLAGGAAKRLWTVCMMPGAGGGEWKKWGIHNYFRLAQALHTRHPELRFDFILGPGEARERDFLQAKQGTGLPFAIHSNLSLAENAALVDSSALVIANDCGPSHIAQCLLRPFIGLYCAKNPEWFFAHEHSAMITPPQGDDIKRISVEQVLLQALGMLRKPASAHCTQRLTKQVA